MINELERMGIRGPLLHLFKDYLNRDFRVKLWEKVSLRKPATGVPQGSILGPMLFLIYSNSIHNLIRGNDTKIFSYADDIAIVVAHESLETAHSTMQDNLNRILLWSHDMNLLINYKKTKLLHIHSPHFHLSELNLIAHNSLCIHTNLAYSLSCSCQETIETVTEFKYLGITLDHRFKFDLHIADLNNKLRTCSYMIYHLRNTLPPDALRVVYLSLVE